MIEVQSAVARRHLSKLMREVTQNDAVVVIRNATRPGEPGVVMMSERRAIVGTDRGGMNLAQLVESFRHSPIKLRSLVIEE